MEILKALWERSKYAAFFDHFPDTMKPKFSLSNLDAQVQSCGYVDYYDGKVIKACIFDTRNEIDPSGYDRDNGRGAFQEVIDGLRRKSKQ
jgi:hypothetical protein